MKSTSRRERGAARRRTRGAALWTLTSGLLLAALVAAGAGASERKASVAAATSRFAISVSQGARFANLFLVTPAGSHRLTHAKAALLQPAWSPNGKKLAYVQTSSATCQFCPWTIWTMNANGSDRRGLTYPQPYKNNPTLYDTSPSWSPDGTQVVFSRSTNNSYHLLVVPASGGIPRDLYVGGVSPAWGPHRIAYLQLPFERPGPVTLWTVNPDGTDAREVTSGYIVTPAWSRSGRLAYLEQPPSGPPVLVVIGGGQLHRHRLPLEHATSVTWSPGGDRLAIVARTSAKAPYEVYSITDTGKDLRRVTSNVDVLGASWRK